MNNEKDSIQFISLGPGDSEMVTLGTLRVLKETNLIFCFATGGVSRAVEIILLLGIPKDRIHTVDIEMQHDRKKANKVYDDVAEEIEIWYSKGKKIAVATEGDSCIFATTHYVLDRLVEKGIPCTQHPGVPSFIAAAAVANLHLVKQQERLMVVPGKITSEEIERLVNNGCNLVIMKLSMAHSAVKEVMEKRPDYKYHYFENVGTQEQKYELLTETPDSFPYFSLMIIQTTQINAPKSLHFAHRQKSSYRGRAGERIFL